MTARSSLRDLDWRALLRDAPNGYDVGADDRAALEWHAGKGAATYGELLPDAASALLAWLAPTTSDVFVDLGSGSGRLPIQAVCETAVGRAVGVELSTGRHAAASRARDLLASAMDDDGRAELAQRLELRCEDLRATALDDVTLIWMSSTAFPEPLFAAACRHIDARAGRLRLLATTTALPPPWDRVFEAVGSLHLATTWSPRTRVHVARRRSAATVPPIAAEAAT
ncbi:MAG: hypothetical protein HZB39_12020 [Planctomycetes bacterium]|nr:hypothetical protein [Planctomycetota bacterium]